MSIHVTVNGNPVYLNQRKILLTDIEQVKKNEWNRRRKIRLQQVRQQAKDLAQNVRQKVSSERSTVESYEREKNVCEQKQKKTEKLEILKQECEQALSSVGSGHQLACLQNECDALLKEKQELRQELARARGAIAEEKLKAEKCLQKEKMLASSGRKNLLRKVEDLRSTLVTNISSTKSTCSTKAQIHHSAEGAKCPLKKPYERQSNLAKRNEKKFPGPSKRESNISQRTKPTLSDCEEEICSDDDSDVTWPPRSVRVIKEPIPAPKVRFYDHSTRVSKECQKPFHAVTLADPFSQPNMSEAIAKEEEAVARKENLDFLARRERMIRGSKALRKERGKKEAEKIIKEIDELERRRRIEMALNRSYPCQSQPTEEWRGNVTAPSNEGFTLSEQDGCDIFEKVTDRHQTLPTAVDRGQQEVTDEMLDKIISVENKSHYHVGGQVDKVNSEELLEDLIRKLKEERRKRQQELEKRFEVSDLKETDIPPWAPQFSRKHADHLEKTAHRAAFLGTEKGQINRKQTVKSPEKQKCWISNGKEDHSEEKTLENRHLSNLSNCGCSDKCNCYKIKESNSNKEVNVQIHPSPKSDIVFEEERTKIPIEQRQSQQQMEEIKTFEEIPPDEEELDEQPQKETSQFSPVVKTNSQETGSSTTDSTSPADTVESSLTYEGVKVVVKVCEKGKKRKSKSPIKMQKKDADVQTSLQSSSLKSATWNSQFSSEGILSSTSYLSPPSRLSPAQQSLIRSVLKKIETRTKNPRLHYFINRLLSMSHESVENLPVSSASDISISSSIFDRNGNAVKDTAQNKNDFCCQAGNSLDESLSQEEALKFSELARCYADRVNDLAGMIDALRILPANERTIDDDTSYLNPPDKVSQSFILSDSIVPGIYPRPADISDIPTSIQPHPSHLQPHPSHLPPQPCHSHLQSQPHHELQRRIKEALTRNLSTIQERDTVHEREEASERRPFDPDVSSIRGTPHKMNHVGTVSSSARSSLCLLDERDVSSFLGSSSDDLEDVFKSLGIAWALPTVRKTRDSRKRSCNSSTSSGQMMYSHSTPLAQSPAKGSSVLPSTSSNKKDSSKHTTKVNTDSLTPPSFTLNIPRLSPNSSPCSVNKHK